MQKHFSITNMNGLSEDPSAHFSYTDCNGVRGCPDSYYSYLHQNGTEKEAQTYCMMGGVVSHLTSSPS